MSFTLCGRQYHKAALMGIVNVTPDSFSDGGKYFDAQAAIEHGFQLVEEGADILDIGGESTRPDATPVSPQQEMDRVLPVIEGLKGCGRPLSIDTRHAQTMAAAASAGVAMINDVSALEHDPQSLSVAVSSGLPVCLMHMAGTPQTMQQDPQYDDVVADVKSYLAARIDVCVAVGVLQENIIADPGIGFGKTLQHNVLLLQHLSAFKDLGVPLLLGVSRKRFIGTLGGDAAADKRLPGSLAAALWGVQQGADIVRVHDVAATRQALDVHYAIADVAAS